MDFISGLLSIFLPIGGVIFVLRFIQRSDGWVEMPEQVFWQFVERHSPADVLIVLRGLFLERACYIYPHHGVVLFTWSRPTILPAGVTETLTFELRTT